MHPMIGRCVLLACLVLSTVAKTEVIETGSVPAAVENFRFLTTGNLDVEDAIKSPSPHQRRRLVTILSQDKWLAFE